MQLRNGRDEVLPLERQNKIIALVEANLSVKVVELSRLFDVTEETIRKDLEKLEKQGVLKRSYGGALLVNNEDTPFEIRISENIEAKNKVGRAVAELIKDGEIVMFDSSTTCLETAKNIAPSKNITVITNGIGVISQMSRHEGVTVVSTGGTLRSRAMSLIGPTAKNNIENYYADKTIISCKGIDEKRGIMDSNELESEIKKAMIACAREVILAINSTKLEKASLYKIADFKAVNTIVIDKMPEQNWVDLFEQYGIKVVIA
ncbi:MAG: DeoR/GlpR family DNA-binding transcription regulator [Cellulosilyticaceae bacterium]